MPEKNILPEVDTNPNLDLCQILAQLINTLAGFLNHLNKFCTQELWYIG